MIFEIGTSVGVKMLQVRTVKKEGGDSTVLDNLAKLHMDQRRQTMEIVGELLWNAAVVVTDRGRKEIAILELNGEHFEVFTTIEDPFEIELDQRWRTMVSRHILVRKDELQTKFFKAFRCNFRALHILQDLLQYGF